MNDNNRKLVGFLLILLGALFLFDRLNIIQFSLFFEGWWTLFLIVPAIVQISKHGVNTGNAILLVIGVFFLLDAQGISLQGFLLPAILVLVGIVVIFRKI